jgi:beta-phosphoglucomutase-like phosphatase (HAD superfamily)
MAPRPLRRPRAVIFDMDGTLLDTEPLAARAGGEAASALGVAFDPALALTLVGKNFADCSAFLRGHFGRDYPTEALLGSWHAAYDGIVAREGFALKDGVHALLDWLDAAAIPRAIATSTRRDRAEAKLAHAALLPRFHAVVGGDEVARGKPAPDIYVTAAGRLGVAPHACVALEDSEPGFRSALAAGMTPILVPDLLPPSVALLELAPLVLPSLDDVRAHLAALPG